MPLNKETKSNQNDDKSKVVYILEKIFIYRLRIFFVVSNETDIVSEEQLQNKGLKYQLCVEEIKDLTWGNRM